MSKSTSDALNGPLAFTPARGASWVQVAIPADAPVGIGTAGMIVRTADLMRNGGPGLLVSALLADRSARQSVQFGANGNGYGIDPLTDEFVSVIRPTYPNEWSVPVTNQPQTFVPVPGARIRIRSCHGCGVPGDCYCHENCNVNETASLCNECAADWQVSRDDDHRDALAMMSGPHRRSCHCVECY